MSDFEQPTIFGEEAKPLRKKKKSAASIFKKDNNYHRALIERKRCLTCISHYDINGLPKCDEGDFMIDRLPMVCDLWAKKEKDY